MTLLEKRILLLKEASEIDKTDWSEDISYLKTKSMTEAFTVLYGKPKS